MEKVDRRLADWTGAYGDLKDAQARLKKQGPRPTPEIRNEVERLQRKAELALKSLTEEFEAAKRLKNAPMRQEPEAQGEVWEATLHREKNAVVDSRSAGQP